MKVLSIGNSFSQDAHRRLYGLAQQNGVDIKHVNLFIGGCGLETHWNNSVENKASCRYELNGIKDEVERYVSIAEALDMDEWDIVTLQQVSNFSGMPQTYIPYLNNLADFVKKKQPNVKLYYHQTWAYEIDFESEAFKNYNCDQSEMFRRIYDASLMAAKLINAEIIPTGSVIQKIRTEIAEFDYKNGGLSLNRDGKHLSMDYGRFAASATWLRKLTGKKITLKDYDDLEPGLANRILDIVNGFDM